MTDRVQVGKDFLEGLYQTLRGRAEELAPHFQPGYGAKELSPDEERTLWNQRAMPIEQEWELHRARNDDGTPKYTREQVGMLVFPERAKMAKGGGRVEPKEMIAWVNATAKRMAAREEAQAMPTEGDY